MGAQLSVELETEAVDTTVSEELEGEIDGWSLAFGAEVGATAD